MNEADQVQSLDLWKVARVDVNALPADRMAEVIAWLDGLDIPTKQCVPWLVLTQSAVDQRYRVHVSVMAHNERDQPYVDFAADRIHSTPHVVVVESFPGWLSGLDHKEP